MALLHLQLATSLPHSTFMARRRLQPPVLFSSVHLTAVRSPTQCMVATKNSDQTITTTITRQSGNYQPSIWDYNYIQSLKSDYMEERYKERANKLKAEVRMMLEEVVDPLHQLELIDVLQRLGLSCHFEHDIDRILTSIHNNFVDDHNNGNRYHRNEKDLYAAALEFRILRQHGFSNIPQEVFSSYLNESNGNFKECLCEDTKGILSLYEASYLLAEGESLLEKARDFTTKSLQEYYVNNNKDHEELLSVLVSHASEFPLHWRVPRVESRWFIDLYEKRHDKNHILLELAKLDYNMLQAIHQEDLKHMSRWWHNLGFTEKLSFSRDRLMENFEWSVGFSPEPQFGYCRRKTTEIFALITTVDDVYDLYGTLDELKLFTDAIERWDITVMDQLPDYMKICFLAVYNSTNEVAFDALRKHGIDVIYYLKKSLADLCKALLLEAEWYYNGYTPTLQEYIDNSWISVGVPAVLVRVFFLVTNPVTEEALECIEQYHDLLRCSSLILRLEDDLEDELRGDIPKAIRCYMHETGASEEDARKYIKDLVSTAWSKMNKAVASADCPFSRDYIRIVMNVARMAQCMYQYGDGHASQDQDSKDRIFSLLIQPINC